MGILSTRVQLRLTASFPDRRRRSGQENPGRDFGTAIQFWTDFLDGFEAPLFNPSNSGMLDTMDAAGGVTGIG